jgi:hypothetical protein
VIFGAGTGLFPLYRTVYRLGQSKPLELLSQLNVFGFEFRYPPVYRLHCSSDLLPRPARCDVLLTIPIESSKVNEHGPFDCGPVARHGEAVEQFRVRRCISHFCPAQDLQPGLASGSLGAVEISAIIEAPGGPK